jgi:hypothetical protein
MSSFWLFISDVFKASFAFFDTFGFVLNWIMVGVITYFFWGWCKSIIAFGKEDKDYVSPTEHDAEYYKS